MTPIGHTLTGLTIGCVVLPTRFSARSKMLTLAVFALLANVPDFRLPGWGHDRYDISHSVFVTAVGVVVLGMFAGVATRGRGILSPALLVGGGLAWYSHLLLDSFYSHGKGIAAYGDMACFSFQNLKLVTPGEGGLILTNNQAYMEACRVYINCGRVQESFQYAQPMIGGNFRMTELQAALARSQFSRFPAQMQTRTHNAAILNAGLGKIDGIQPVKGDARQTRVSYYHYFLTYESEAFAGIPRAAFTAAVQAEGIPLGGSGGQPVYKSPLFPWETSRWKRLYGERMDYSKVVTPVAERATRETTCGFAHEVLLGTEADMQDIITAVDKVHRHAEELRAWQDPAGPKVITRS